MTSTAGTGAPAGSSRRLRIGVMAAYIGDPVGNEFWQVVRQKAVQHDVDLVGICDTQQASRATSNACLKHLVQDNGFDGMLLTFKHLASSEEADHRRRLTEILAGTPVVSLMHVVPGATSLVPDADAALRECIQHLVTVHGRRRIGIIDATPSRQPAIEGVLAEHGCASRWFSRGDQAEWLVWFAEDQHPDGLVFTQSSQARAAITTLQDHGILVPQDVAIATATFYPLNKCLCPRLAHCGPSQAELTARGFDLLVDLVRTNAEPVTIVLEPDFFGGDTCGCERVPRLQRPQDLTAPTMLERARMLVHSRAIEQGQASDQVVFADELHPWVEDVIEALLTTARVGKVVLPPGFSLPPTFPDHLVQARRRMLWVMQDLCLNWAGGDTVEDLWRHFFRQAVTHHCGRGELPPGFRITMTSDMTARLSRFCDRITYVADLDALRESTATNLPLVDLRHLAIAVNLDGEVTTWNLDDVVLACTNGHHRLPERRGPGLPIDALPGLTSETTRRCVAILRFYAIQTPGDGLIIIDGDTDGVILERLRKTFNEAVLATMAHERGTLQAQQLAVERNLLRSIIDTVPDAIYVKDCQGRYLVANQVCADDLGADSIADLLGQRNTDFMDAEAAAFYRNQEQIIVSTGEPVINEPMVNRAGKNLLISKFPVCGPDGKIIGLVGINRDVSDLHRAEHAVAQHTELLQRSQKFEAIGRLAGGIAHDFNNILTIVQNSAELILRHTDSERITAKAEAIMHASRRAGDYTHNLLSFASSTFHEPFIFDLNMLLRQAQDLVGLALGDPIVVAYGLTDRACAVKADSMQVEQILLNLVVNARDAMPAGGHLTIRTSVETITEVGEQGQLRPGPYVRLDVIDTGTGIQPENLDRIFDPFFTTKDHRRGSGLGLATSYGLVRQFGGEITVDSTPGKGSTFSVLLPHQIEPVYEASDTTISAEPIQGNETILVVDDEAHLSELIAENLADIGYQVLHSNDAIQALDLVDEHPGPIHLLISDIMMPGISGIELAEQIGFLKPGIKILLMSGYTTAPDDLNAHGDLVLHFIQKPFSISDLSDAVRLALETSSKRIYKAKVTRRVRKSTGSYIAPQNSRNPETH